jgi:hypothetical protein
LVIPEKRTAGPSATRSGRDDNYIVNNYK